MFNRKWKEKVEYEKRYTGDYSMHFPRGIGVQICPAEEKLWNNLVERANQSYHREGPRASQRGRRHNPNRIVEEGDDISIDEGGRVLRKPRSYLGRGMPRPASEHTKAHRAGARSDTPENRDSGRILRSSTQPIEVKKKKTWWKI